MREFLKKIKFIIPIVIFLAIIAALPFVFYLKVLPYVVSNEQAISYVEQYVKESSKLDLVVKKPVLKTDLSPELSFSVDEISLKKDNASLLNIKNFDTTISFEKVFEKTIVLKKVGLDDLFADVNKLMALSTEPAKPQKKSDWTVEWLDSILYLKNCYIIYDVDKKTKVEVFGKNMEITSSREPKFVRFDLKINVTKGKDKLRIVLFNKNNIYIKDHKIFIDKAKLGINRSSVYINAFADLRMEGLKILSKTYDDKLLMTFVSDFKSSNAYKESFNKSVELAKLRNVPENERIKSKADIDCYFRGGSLK